MNIKEYIESGILEAYVSGTVSDQERREVRCLSTVYPEIQAELDVLENTMNQYALEYSTPAPSGLKNKVMDAISNTDQVPAMNVVSAPSIQKELDSPVSSKPKSRDPAKFPWRIAATLLLLISCGLLFFLVTLEDDYKNEIDSQKNNITELENKLDNIIHENNSQKEKLALVTSPSTLKIPLKSASGSSQDMAMVFWDSSNQSVYLDPEQLASVPDDKQYQLWALKDGQPIDLGTVLKGDIGFQQMKNTAEADAFAITLEPLGGSAQPTLEELKVIGNI